MTWWWRLRSLCAYLRDIARTPRVLVLRLLRVPCAEFGGLTRDGRERWCLKNFGHSDSCAYDICVEQPMRLWRRRAKGWDS